MEITLGKLIPLKEFQRLVKARIVFEEKNARNWYVQLRIKRDDNTIFLRVLKLFSCYAERLQKKNPVVINL